MINLLLAHWPLTLFALCLLVAMICDLKLDLLKHRAELEAWQIETKGDTK